MNLFDYDISGLVRLLEKREISSHQVVSFFIDIACKTHGQLNAFIEICVERALASATEIDNRRSKGEKLQALAGIPIAVKDNICTKGIKTTCASRMLGDFIPEYDATVVKKLRDSGMIIIGKTNLDEFAMGSTGEYSAFGLTKNPHDTSRVAGGSSSGSAAVVAAGATPIALGTDTGGSVRIPAAYCGIAGLKPSYGAVSRYGLIAYASSFDQIGIMGKKVEDTRLLARVIYGHDLLDSTSAKNDWSELNVTRKHEVSGLRFGYCEAYLKNVGAEMQTSFFNALKKLGQKGAEIIRLKPYNNDHLVAIYYVLTSAECASNLARFDGIKYGLSPDGANSLDELTTQARTVGFGDEVKRRILLGNYVLSEGFHKKYYEKACKARILVTKEINKRFDEVDFIISPVTDSVAPKVGSFTDTPSDMYDTDCHNVTANLAGIPAIAVPAGRSSEGLPVGIQLMAKRFKDARLLDVAKTVEKLLNETSVASGISNCNRA